MQIERLNYFVEVARVQSINSASESLHISQQALSQSMHSLEKELGVTLFKRSNKGIQLTEKREEPWRTERGTPGRKCAAGTAACPWWA